MPIQRCKKCSTIPSTIHELPSLENISNELEIDEELFYSDSEEQEVIELAIIHMDDFIQNNILDIKDDSFYFVLEDEMLDFLDSILQTLPIDYNITSMVDYHSMCVSLFRKTYKLYNSMFPSVKRSYKGSYILEEQTEARKRDLDTRLQVIYDKDENNPAQRTDEWYLKRHTHISASSAYKCLESQSQINSIIYEKCQPLQISSNNNTIDVDADENEDTENENENENETDTEVEEENVKHVNIHSALHWGQKYEPVSQMYYEGVYNTKIREFGSIVHSKYSFLGASPDGINIDRNTDRYGRMLEIKSPKTRKLTGIPKKEYWVQMQLQMECCNLDECDFLECVFEEYTSENEFYNHLYNKHHCFHKNKDCQYVGIIAWFNDKHGNPVYEYLPFRSSYEFYLVWEKDIREKHQDKQWIRFIYWKLVDVSCVLVTRNQLWFQEALPKFEEVWKTIEYERIHGYEHRAPKRRQTNQDTNQNDTTLQSETPKKKETINGNNKPNPILMIHLDF